MSRATNVWAVVPVKTLGQSKSRLSTFLTPEERAALSLDMLLRVFSALQHASTLRGWIAVSSDEKVLALAAERGGHPLAERVEGLNCSLSQAAAEIVGLGGEAVLVVPADVPLLTSGDIDAIVSLAAEERSAVVAPARRRDGTNALLLRPPTLLPFSFGPGSFEAHLALATEAGAVLHVYSSDAVAFDVDTEADWRELMGKLSLVRPE